MFDLPPNVPKQNHHWERRVLPDGTPIHSMADLINLISNYRAQCGIVFNPLDPLGPTLFRPNPEGKGLGGRALAEKTWNQITTGNEDQTPVRYAGAYRPATKEELARDGPPNVQASDDDDDGGSTLTDSPEGYEKPKGMPPRVKLPKKTMTKDDLGAIDLPDSESTIPPASDASTSAQSKDLLELNGKMNKILREFEKLKKDKAESKPESKPKPKSKDDHKVSVPSGAPDPGGDDDDSKGDDKPPDKPFSINPFNYGGKPNGGNGPGGSGPSGPGGSGPSGPGGSGPSGPGGSGPSGPGGFGPNASYPHHNMLNGSHRNGSRLGDFRPEMRNSSGSGSHGDGSGNNGHHGPGPDDLGHGPPMRPQSDGQPPRRPDGNGLPSGIPSGGGDGGGNGPDDDGTSSSSSATSSDIRRNPRCS